MLMMWLVLWLSVQLAAMRVYKAGQVGIPALVLAKVCDVCSPVCVR